MVDGGDQGDTYNWCPPDEDTLVDEPIEVAVSVLEQGPLRARLRVDRRYRWPDRVAPDGRQRTGSQPVVVATTLELRAGERFVRVEVEFDNQCEDHRVRVWFPLPQRATTSEAECAFSIVERGLAAEGGPTETPLPTFPSRRFVRAGGLVVAHEGMNEYELVDIDDHGAGALAITVLRANRWLSAGPMATRPLPAGPIVELHGSQCLGVHRMRFAVAIGDEDPFALVEDAFVPLMVTNGAALGSLPARRQGLSVVGAVTSAVRRTPDGRLELRCFNPSDDPGELRIPGRSGAEVDLTGREVARFNEVRNLRPHEIVTLRLEAPGAD